MTTEHKAEILAHCLWMAERDSAYAIWAAGWYESNEPQLLKNLQAKVRQEVARGRRSSSESPPDAVRTTESTGP